MATTMKLSDLMLAVRQRADMVPNGYAAALTGNGFFVTEPELISYINQSLFELYDLMISCYGANYFVKAPPYTVATDGTTSQYALPADFYKLLGVDILISGTTSQAVTLNPFEFRDRNKFSVPNFQSFRGVSNLKYRLNGPNLWMIPTPASGQTLQVWYVPTLTQLAALTDTTDGVSGWTEYVIVDSAIKCLQKEESDVSVLMAEKQALMTRIQAMADSRDVGAPHKVTDSLGSDSWWPGNGNGSGEGPY